MIQLETTITHTEKKRDAIDEGLSRMYDLAVDHAIEVVRRHYVDGGSNIVNAHVDAIVDQLKRLKK